ncbi:hypothetical protein ABZX85_45365, partial [Streptomyces sp. NPDC004539]
MGERDDPDDVGVPSADVVVRIRDLAGRPRGLGFLADHHGTLITAHEVVDGLPRIVLYGAGDRTCVVTADAVTPLPELDLALVRTDGLGTDPLPVTVRDEVPEGTYVRVAAGAWREARVLCAAQVTYTATDRFHLLDDALELAIGTTGRDALRLGGGAAGGPVLDAATGTVVAVLGTALHSAHRDVGFAIPLRPSATRSAPLTTLLTHNAATVPAYGPDLNLAGVLELTATSVGSDGPQGALSGCVGGWPGEAEGEYGVAGGGTTGKYWDAGVDGGGRASGVWGGGVGESGEAGAGVGEGEQVWAASGRGVDGGARSAGVGEGGGRSWFGGGGGKAGGGGGWFGGVGVVPVERAVPVREFAAFSAGTASVLALVGPPGSGRTTELAALAARRHRAVEPAPTLWLRGADLRDDDESLADAAGRALRRAARIVTTSQAPTAPPDPETLTPADLSHIARTAGRPLYLLLDGPEEMPPVLAHRLSAWTNGTVHWLHETGARLVLACRPEYWESAGTHFPPAMLHTPHPNPTPAPPSDASHPNPTTEPPAARHPNRATEPTSQPSGAQHADRVAASASQPSDALHVDRAAGSAPQSSGALHPTFTPASEFQSSGTLHADCATEPPGAQHADRVAASASQPSDALHVDRTAGSAPQSSGVLHPTLAPTSASQFSAARHADRATEPTAQSSDALRADPAAESASQPSGALHPTFAPAQASQPSDVLHSTLAPAPTSQPSGPLPPTLAPASTSQPPSPLPPTLAASPAPQSPHPTPVTLPAPQPPHVSHPTPPAPQSPHPTSSAPQPSEAPHPPPPHPTTPTHPPARPAFEDKARSGPERGP